MTTTQTTDRELPATLPADASGYTKSLIVHMNFGDDGGAARYSIHGPGGADTPITYQYDTRKEATVPKGFFIEGVDHAFNSWADLANYWPTYIAERA